MARLTAQEKQEIIRFPEVGKPLSDKYRFLLFDDKREVELVWNGKTHKIYNVVLPDFSVFYSQDSIANAEAGLKDKQSKIVVDKGRIVKVSKDKNGIVNREMLTKTRTDWIDYWTGDYIFENEWQSFRTRKDRKLELKSIYQEVTPGRRKIAVKVVDIFGNDTMTIGG